MAEHGRIGHVEWESTDLARTKAFYGALFGWEFRDFGEGYAVFRAAGHAGGGFQKVEGRAAGGAGTSPTVYVEVREIAGTVERALSLGGTLETPRTAIPGAGSFAHLRDPDGNRVALYEDPPAP